MTWKNSVILTIISVVYSSAIDIKPIHISSYLPYSTKEHFPSEFIFHVGHTCILYEFLRMQSEITEEYTTKITRNNIFNFGDRYKTKIAKLFKYMTDDKYDHVGKFMYDAYEKIDILMNTYAFNYYNEELDDYESTLYKTLDEIVNLPYWTIENMAVAILYIPENLYEILISRTKDILHIDDEMDGLRDVCQHLLSNQDSVECFKQVLTNLNKSNFNKDEKKFAIMNYHTIINCDDVSPMTLNRIVSRDSLKADVTNSMKLQMQNVLCVYSELLSIMYNKNYIINSNDNNDIIINYLNVLLEEFIEINEYTKEFSSYLYIMKDYEINSFTEKFMTFQLIFRIHFEKFLYGFKEVHIDENPYLKFILHDSYEHDYLYIMNDDTIKGINFSNNNIYMYDLRDEFRKIANEHVDDELMCEEFQWKSVDFNSLTLFSPLIPFNTNGNIEDIFSFEQRMNIVKFLRLNSQHLQRNLKRLVNLNGDKIIPEMNDERYYSTLHIKSLPLSENY